MDNFGLIEFLLLVLDILEIDGTLGEIDEAALLVYGDDLHVVLRADSEQLSDVLNSLTGSV